MTDRFDLERFVSAQAPVFTTTLAELTAGRKSTHWMWFVFPQISGLGHSPMARRYAIGSTDEARAYLAHPLLGARLEAATEAVLSTEERSAYEIFGTPDDLKFRSSMTLFAQVAPTARIFTQALTRFFEGPDEATLARLRQLAD